MRVVDITPSLGKGVDLQQTSGAGSPKSQTMPMPVAWI
jgi:hypothetical protein